jgi:hypothetical protein
VATFWQGEESLDSSGDGCSGDVQLLQLAALLRELRLLARPLDPVEEQTGTGCWSLSHESQHMMMESKTPASGLLMHRAAGFVVAIICARDIPVPLPVALCDGVLAVPLAWRVKSPYVEDGDIGGIPAAYCGIGDACHVGDCGTEWYPCHEWEAC